MNRLPVACLSILLLASVAFGQDAACLIRSRCHRSPSRTIPRRRPRSCSAAADRGSAAARAIGFYSRGCLAGAVAMPINGKTWQVMRLSRNRNWGHPELIEFLERLAAKAPKVGWNGLLVGDLTQPRGGPMLTGHASHQVGLDAEIWLTPMPDRELTRQEREEMSATMVVAPDRKDVDPRSERRSHVAILKAAAQEPKVERVLVNAAIKKALCRDSGQRPRLAARRCARSGATTTIPCPHRLPERQPGV